MIVEDIQAREPGNLEEERGGARPAKANPMIQLHVGASANFATAMDTYQLHVGRILPIKELTREQPRVHSRIHHHLLHLLHKLLQLKRS